MFAVEWAATNTDFVSSPSLEIPPPHRPQMLRLFRRPAPLWRKGRMGEERRARLLPSPVGWGGSRGRGRRTLHASKSLPPLPPGKISTPALAAPPPSLRPSAFHLLRGERGGGGSPGGGGYSPRLVFQEGGLRMQSCWGRGAPASPTGRPRGGWLDGASWGPTASRGCGGAGARGGAARAGWLAGWGAVAAEPLCGGRVTQGRAGARAAALPGSGFAPG